VRAHEKIVPLSKIGFKPWFCLAAEYSRNLLKSSAPEGVEGGGERAEPIFYVSFLIRIKDEKRDPKKKQP
jgi:hypothetical protein